MTVRDEDVSPFSRPEASLDLTFRAIDVGVAWLRHTEHARAHVIQAGVDGAHGTVVRTVGLTRGSTRAELSTTESLCHHHPALWQEPCHGTPRATLRPIPLIEAKKFSSVRG